MSTTQKNTAPGTQLADQVYWLTHLRWVAIAGVIATVFIASRFFHIILQVRPLYAVTGFLAAYNGLFAWGVARFKKQRRPSAIQIAANLQIFLDLTCLALLIHFSGGLENPFYFYFIFHIIIAGILLSRRETFVLATYAIVIFLGVVFLEQCGFLAHHCLRGVFSGTFHADRVYFLGVSFVFISTLYIAAYLTSSISGRLREHERDLRNANVLLGEKDRIKSEYVLRVTHDLKEDLAAIHTCIEPIQKGLTGPLNEEQTNLLFRARDRSKHLILYVDELLEITRLKLTQRMEMNYFSVEELVREIAASITPIAQDKKITFEILMAPEMPRMRGARVYIQEALLNLLKNALRYTPERGKVSWQIEADPARLRVTITDNGIGIPKEDLPKVFDEFYRAGNARAMAREGTGLGLSLTKKIVEMHQGKVWLESELGKGTCVRMEIPMGGT